MIRGLTDAEVLLKRYEQEPIHVRHVAKLAGQLFASLRSWHQRDDIAANHLHLAALLHDIGWSQSPDGSGHHKQSARLILAHAWQELLPADVPLIAQIARYHRKSLPCEKHKAYHALDAGPQQLVCELGGILRVADALDRTHTQRVQTVTATVKPHVIELSIRSLGPWIEERRMVLKKCDLLEIASQRKVRFVD